MSQTKTSAHFGKQEAASRGWELFVQIFEEKL